MSQLPAIERDDLTCSIGDDRLDALLAEPFRRDDPGLSDKMARRLAWALGAGTWELTLYIDLAKYNAQPELYREYAAAFALFHLERTTSGGASTPSRDAFDLQHKNLALAHKGERLPGERNQRSTVTAMIIADESSWSRDKMRGFE